MRVGLLPLLGIAAVAGCASSARLTTGSAPIAPGPATLAATNDAGGDGAADAAVGPALSSIEALSARGPSLAAGMREVARGELVVDAGNGARDVAPAADRDRCVRVAVTAQPAVHAWLTDARGDVLADAKDLIDGALGTRGPVCVLKGDAVSLHLEAAAAFTARFVSWASP